MRSVHNPRMSMPRASLPLWIKAVYGAPSFAGAAVAIPILIHMPKFYSDVVLVPVGWIAMAIAIARALDAITDPAIGWLSDRTESRLGRRRPWIALRRADLRARAGRAVQPADEPHAESGRRVVHRDVRALLPVPRDLRDPVPGPRLRALATTTTSARACSRGAWRSSSSAPGRVGRAGRAREHGRRGSAHADAHHRDRVRRRAGRSCSACSWPRSASAAISAADASRTRSCPACAARCATGRSASSSSPS